MDDQKVSCPCCATDVRASARTVFCRECGAELRIMWDKDIDPPVPYIREGKTVDGKRI